ncbi:MAG: hypothetical protein JKY31_13935 [Rhodobacteraceae bacterium]|nr:hypothetical protein [Paracoccaceae bacterium]
MAHQKALKIVKAFMLWILFSTSGAALAQESAEISSSDPLNIINGRLSQNCPYGELPTWDETTVTILDINADGQDDYVIPYNTFHCANGPSGGYCGSAGCRTEIWISNIEMEWTLGFSSNVRELALESDDKGGQILVLNQHGTFCRKAGADRCILKLIWQEGEFVWAAEQDPSMDIRLRELAMEGTQN